MMHLRSHGFTLIELVITMTLMGILSAVAVTNISAREQHSVTVQADQFRRDLSHIQLLAVSRDTRLKLTVTSGSYAVCAAATVTCNAAGAITDPATGTPFSVTLTDGASFTAGTGSYYFDSLGRPVSAATGSTLVSSVTSFSLNGVGRNGAVTVTVQPITGFAQAAY